jgi:hypothetical protein
MLAPRVGRLLSWESAAFARSRATKQPKSDVAFASESRQESDDVHR